MKCPACHNQISYCKICPYCKKDVVVSAKVISLSNKYYNLALNQAKKNELSLAIDNLNKSLTLYKSNKNARNLLGLIYYRIGRISDALKHWIISMSLNKNGMDNPANNYLLLAQQNFKVLTRYDDAIKFFNSALKSINEGNNDLGLIQLKKSLELNPNFVEASNLLALFYIYQGEKHQAKELLENTLSVDKNNPTANRYLKLFFPDNAFEINDKSDTNRNKFIDIFSFSRIAIFLCGIFLGIVTLYILIYPSQIETKNKSISKLERELDTVQENYDVLNKKYETEIPKLKQQNDKLTQENKKLNESILRQQTQEKLDQAKELFDEKNFTQAAEILYNLNAEQESILSGQAMALKKKIYPQTANFYYSKALKQYNAKYFADAKKNFEKALLYSDEVLANKIKSYIEKINLL